MILIEITGQTYPWREKYKSLGFQWRPNDKTWWKMEAEASLQSTMEGLRNQWIGQNVQIQLAHSDIEGNLLSENVVIVEKLAVASAESEEVDWLTTVNHIITNDCRTTSPPVKKKKPVDPGFF